MFSVSRQMSRIIYFMFFAIIILAASQKSAAGVFSVSPVRIYPEEKARAMAVTIVNEGDSEVVLQADIYSWRQDAKGDDLLELSDDLVIAPPIIKLAPKARRVVRLGILKRPQPHEQGIYRLVLREVPEANKTAENGLTIPIALALSIPIFISSKGLKEGLECSIGDVHAKDKNIRVRCVNFGNAYTQIRSIILLSGEQTVGTLEGGIYILPGISKDILVGLKQEAKIKSADPVRIEVALDDGRKVIFDKANTTK